MKQDYKVYIKYLFLSLMMLAVSSGLLYWCFAQVDVVTFLHELYRFKAVILLLAIAVLLTSLVLKTLQWRFFIPKQNKLSFTDLFEVVCVMFMMANIVPWGQIFTIYHLGQLQKVGKVKALSVLTLDQLVMGLAKLIMLLFVAIVAPLPIWAKNSIFLTIALIVVVSILFFYISHHYRALEEQRLNTPLFSRKMLAHLIARWGHYLHVLRDYKLTLSTFFLAILLKLSEVAAIYLVQLSFGLDLPLWTAFLLTVSINMATMFPITPGNIGTFEATTFVIYKYLGFDPSQAMTLSLFHHLIYLVPMIIPGYVCSIRRGISISRSFLKQNKS